MDFENPEVTHYIDFRWAKSLIAMVCPFAGAYELVLSLYICNVH